MEYSVNNLGFWIRRESVMRDAVEDDSGESFWPFSATKP
jgi:hypothetical protein